MRCVDDFRCAKCLKDKEYIEFDFSVYAEDQDDLWLDFCVQCELEEEEAEEFARSIFVELNKAEINKKYRSKRWQEINKKL